MSGDIGQLWAQNPIGYRQGDLTASDGVAVTAVTTVGGPALVVGSVLAAVDGLGLFQILLVAPIAAILGGIVIAGSARMAAATGAGPTWLLRPAFGGAGSRLVSLLRLVMIVLWAAVVLSLIGDWGAEAGAGWGIPSAVVMVAVAAVAFAMALGGSRTIALVIRFPLFLASIAMIGVAAIFVVQEGSPSLPGTEGSIWGGIERGVEMAAVFVPFIQSVARRITDEENAASSFGVGYVIPVTLTMAVGAVFASQFGGWPVDLTAVGPAATGAMFVVAWVVVAEIDQVFASFVAAGSDLVGIIPGVAEWLLGLVASVAIVVTAVIFGHGAFDLASLAAAVIFPAAAIALADFFFSSDRYYSQSELYGADAGRRPFNLIGIACWVGTVALGQWLAPMAPLASVDAFAASAPSLMDGPWRMVATLAGVSVYIAITRTRQRRGASVHQLRGL